MPGFTRSLCRRAGAVWNDYGAASYLAGSISENAAMPDVIAAGAILGLTLLTMLYIALADRA